MDNRKSGRTRSTRSRPGPAQPQVRAGVLRLLSTLPEVTVRSADINGEATLTLTATAPALPADYQETLTINGTTGVPIGFAGGAPGTGPTSRRPTGFPG